MLVEGRWNLWRGGKSYEKWNKVNPFTEVLSAETILEVGEGRECYRRLRNEGSIAELQRMFLWAGTQAACRGIWVLAITGPLGKLMNKSECPLWSGGLWYLHALLTGSVAEGQGGIESNTAVPKAPVPAPTKAHVVPLLTLHSHFWRASTWPIIILESQGPTPVFKEWWLVTWGWERCWSRGACRRRVCEGKGTVRIKPDCSASLPGSQGQAFPFSTK